MQKYEDSTKNLTMLNPIRDDVNKTSLSPRRIEIDSLRVVDKTTIEYKISFSEDIAKYFGTDHFTVEYDTNIDKVDKSILVIPALAGVITLAWATGTDVYVEYADKTYLDGLDRVKAVFEKWFPEFSFATRIYAKNITGNESSKSPNGKYALLFTGGVDSLTSYIRNREKQPTLIHCNVWGALNISDKYWKGERWNEVRNKLRRFANQEGRDIRFIKTNLRWLIPVKMLEDEFLRPQEEWWETVSHGLILTGLTAPILTAEGIGTLLIGSTHHRKEDKIRDGDHVFSYSVTDGVVVPTPLDMGCGNTKVVYDSPDLTRQEKLRYIFKGYPSCYPYLRVCDGYSAYNCGKCPKCLRTIVGLTLEGVDPQKCGFRVRTGVLILVKNYLRHGLLYLDSDTQIDFWEDIQKHIPADLSNSDLYNSKAFFEWYRQFDLTKYRAKCKAHIYNSKIATFLRTYYLMRYDPVYSLKLILEYIKRRLKILGNGSGREAIVIRR